MQINAVRFMLKDLRGRNLLKKMLNCKAARLHISKFAVRCSYSVSLSLHSILLQGKIDFFFHFHALGSQRHCNADFASHLRNAVRNWGGNWVYKRLSLFHKKIFLMTFPLWNGVKPEPDSFVPWRCPLETAAEGEKNAARTWSAIWWHQRRSTQVRRLPRAKLESTTFLQEVPKIRSKQAHTGSRHKCALSGGG